jgi:helix-turn-helix protein
MKRACSIGRQIPAAGPAVHTGHHPLPEAGGLGQQPVRRRTSVGLTQKEAAKLLGVDPSTLARWERGEREPEGGVAGRVEGFLGERFPSTGAWTGSLLPAN